MDKMLSGASAEQARGYTILHVVLTPTTGLSLTGHRLTRTSSLPTGVPSHAERDRPAEDNEAEDQDLEPCHADRFLLGRVGVSSSRGEGRVIGRPRRYFMLLGDGPGDT